MNAVDIAPFLVVFVVGAAAGRFTAGRMAWWIAAIIPGAHFVLSIVTGRTSEEFLGYVVPVNIVLLGVAVVGVLTGRWLRGRGEIDRASKPHG